MWNVGAIVTGFSVTGSWEMMKTESSNASRFRSLFPHGATPRAFRCPTHFMGAIHRCHAHAYVGM